MEITNIWTGQQKPYYQNTEMQKRCFLEGNVQPSVLTNRKDEKPQN